jgi:carboxyl-terminal processing protease
MNNKKIQVWLPLLFSIVMIAGMMIGFKLKENMPDTAFFHVDKKKPVTEIMQLIERNYVDSVRLDSINGIAIESLLLQLDPHSVYIPVSSVQEFKEELAGKFYGIGIEYNIIEDTVHVLSVLPGGPSDKAGLQVGDRFLKVDDSAVAAVKITPDRIKPLLRGALGTTVDVEILRNNQRKAFTITRGSIPLLSVDAAYMLAPATGYIKLNRFSETTYEEFMQATERLQKSGMQNMILDLRDNGGGILTEATEIADEFLDGDKLITYTQGKSMPRKEYRAKRPGLFERGNVVMLADEYTASASEVLIGALQDWDRATVIGRRTFGKGLVQDQFSLSDGSALRLTVARYYTPLGRSIQKPYTSGERTYADEVINRFQNSEVLSADSIKHDQAKLFKTKAGKNVYGGGGITPDIFVPFDTSRYSDIVSKLYAKDIINDFVYLHYMQHRQLFSSFKTAQEFVDRYQIDDAAWKSLQSFAAKDSISLTALSGKDRASVQLRLKAFMARQLWRNEGFYRVFNQQDEMVKKALSVLFSPPKA